MKRKSSFVMASLFAACGLAAGYARAAAPQMPAPADIVSRLEMQRTAGLTVDVFATKRLGELKSHGKIMLLDGRTAVVGSLALAALSLDLRREVAIVVDEPSAVAQVERLFQSIEAAPVAGRITVGEASPEARC